MKYLLIALIALSGCGKAHSNSQAQIELQTGPQGERCYVFYQDGRAFAGQCK